MNNTMKVLTFLIGFMLCFSLSWAGNYEITATWEMDAPVDLAGFEFRVNAGDVIDIPDADTRAWAGTLKLNDDNNTFELRAYDLADQRSEWSTPAGHDPSPNRPVLTVIVVK